MYLSIVKMGCRKLTYYNEVEKTASGKLFFSAKSPLKKSGRPFFLNVEGNHLGNVLTVVSDKKLPIASITSPTEVEYFISEILSATDYSSFGAPMSGRNFNNSASRVGFNGQEKVDEIAGEGNHYSAEHWEYDARLGKRWNMDPRTYPWQSPYACFNNNPVYFSDPSGLEGEGSTGAKKDKVVAEKGAWDVANRNNITLDQLAKWNPEIFPEGIKSGTYMLHPGQELNVSDPVLATEAKPTTTKLATAENKVKQPNKVFTPKTTTVRDGTDASSLGVKTNVNQKIKSKGSKWVADPSFADDYGKYGSEKVDEAHTTDVDEQDQRETAMLLFMFRGEVADYLTEKEPHTNPFYQLYKGPVEPMDNPAVWTPVKYDTTPGYLWNTSIKVYFVDTIIKTKYSSSSPRIEVLDSNKNHFYYPSTSTKVKK